MAASKTIASWKASFALISADVSAQVYAAAPLRYAYPAVVFIRSSIVKTVQINKTTRQDTISVIYEVRALRTDEEGFRRVIEEVDAVMQQGVDLSSDGHTVSRQWQQDIAPDITYDEAGAELYRCRLVWHLEVV